MRKLIFKSCRICGQPVTPTPRKDRKAFWYPRQCANCYKKSRNEMLRRKHISQAFQGMKHPRAKPMGSRRLTQSRGYQYWVIKVNASGRWRYEHRVILEQKLGRQLSSREIAHHINGDTLDNRPENIELWQWGEHTALHHQR